MTHEPHLLASAQLLHGLQVSSIRHVEPRVPALLQLPSMQEQLPGTQLTFAAHVPCAAHVQHMAAANLVIIEHKGCS